MKINTLIFIFHLLFNSLLPSYAIDVDKNKNNNKKLDLITLNRDNHISILGTIEKTSVDKAILDLNEIRQDSYYVFINSPGGYVEEGERLVTHMTYLQESGKTLNCIAENAHSMAFYIFQNCNYRYILPSSKVMQHQITVPISGQLANIQNYIQMIQKMSHRMNLFTAQRIGISLEQFNKLVSTDWWLYGQEIIDKGVADRMVLVGCNTTKEAFLLQNGEIQEMAHPCPLVNVVVTLSS